MGIFSESPVLLGGKYCGEKCAKKASCTGSVAICSNNFTPVQAEGRPYFTSKRHTVDV
jgi:hypothetical protein